MTNHVLILGGQGRIGSAVANDILNHTQADITITGRFPDSNLGLSERVKFLQLNLTEVEKLRTAIAQSNLVIHCAGPFHYRDTQVLEICIDQGVNYVDVSDHRSYTQKALNLYQKAFDAGVTAIINSGIFPGISNSLVRQGIEQFEQPEKIHLSYLVSGSGGAGVTVMRTTFLGLQHPFKAWINGEWRLIQPYTDREVIDFPAPYRRSGVYWFDMPETITLPASFPTVKTVITKFGSVPDLYNHLTWITAHIFPKWLMQKNETIEFLSHVSHRMTDFTNIFTGIGVAVRAEVTGQKDGKTLVYAATLLHENTAVAAGIGTGSICKLLLENKLNKPGVYPVEAALSTDVFTQIMRDREIQINCQWYSAISNQPIAAI
ncbi:saccharopine dehydrogenase NADP-binding domain-containing protein [Sphaerospermopsis aphanizomenoides BCCUSP55]|uniref:saccharopine dehydrogenase family protein n=1 Tax=Sphaerospermopsis aphanizomenoides TaxID=459663 RepID=UPI000AD7D74C|nr:saccharopine dehydrogenase NADP-binding domain-containing protein [Sphaerospermopsis aphanizomenoides]MBK1990193.1 saccharopine dehydrogenase NADP-binding domain-containing protein [Sphaerospermopsis aphanizomenoides BCCUSP55]